MSKENVVAIPSNRPRCYLVHAMAPEGVSARDANNAINKLVGDSTLPLALWHDHFLGDPGGCAVFYVENKDQQKALFGNDCLTDWKVEYRPMVFSFSPSAFDAQIGYTLKNYGDSDWESLRTYERPDYEGRDIQQESNTAKES